MNPTVTRILLADDHALMRAGVRSVLEQHEWLNVVAEATNGREALRLMGEHRPDVALIDIAMPELTGLEVLEQAASAFPEIKIVLLSMHDTKDFITKALCAGARGYLLKDSTSDELELALRTVMRGDIYLSAHMTTQMAGALAQMATMATVATAPINPLTPRQIEVLCCIARGLSTKEIAYQLQLSAKTVETHRAQLMSRLELRDIASLVRYAIRNNLVPLDLDATRPTQSHP